jgi:hypothetical protein
MLRTTLRRGIRGVSEGLIEMSRKRKPAVEVDEQGFSWNDDDFNLDSFGVQAPLQERLQSLMQGGFTPEQVSIDIQEKYAKYLEQLKKKKETEKGMAGTGKK